MATIRQEGKQLLIETTQFKAAINIEGYVSGVAEGSFLDKKTGSHDPGFGLMIADFLLAPGIDSPETPSDLRYAHGDGNHGNIAKHYVSLPQICTHAKSLPHEITEGDGFVSVRQWYEWKTPCTPYNAGSKWEQTLLFPDDKRWFIAWDRFACADDIPKVMMRMDMPCHIKHHGGDVFKQVYLSYHGVIAQHEFHQNFPPDAKFLYRRDDKKVPRRYIRAIQLENDLWLAGMALDPSIVYEAWCHQRDYVCFIQEIGGREAIAHKWTNAVHLVGWFDSIQDMEKTYDEYRGAAGLNISTKTWSIEKESGRLKP